VFDRELEIIAHDPLNPGFGFALRVTRGDVEIARVELTRDEAKALIQRTLVESGYDFEG